MSREPDTDFAKNERRSYTRLSGQDSCGTPDGAVTLHAQFELIASRTPDAIAVLEDARRWSYAELNRHANRLAQHLISVGIGRDALVGICVERSLQLVAGLLGIMKAGGAYVPLDAAYPRERLALMIGDARLSVLLTQRSLLESLPSSNARLICIDEPGTFRESPLPEENLPLRAGAEDLAYVIYTSGSTGRPKGVMIPHGAILNHMGWMQTEFPLERHDRVLQKTPISFDASVWEFYAPLFSGAQLVMARPGGHRDPRYLIEAIAQHEITILQLVPSMLEALVAEPGFAQCASLRRVFCGGEALAPQLCDRFFARLPRCELVNLYGPTECSIDATFHRCRPGATLVPIGRAVANTQLHILDPEGRPVSGGEVGELHIGGAQLARGYLHQPELTAAKFISLDGARVYKTGDLARFLPGGEVEYLGRGDDQVKIRGYRIELGEIEHALRAHPALRSAVVVARERFGADELVAYVIESAAVRPAELRDWLRQTLPEHMIPVAFVSLEAFPLTANGKIDRRALPEPDLPRAKDAAAPATELERVVQRIWVGLIGTNEIGVNDNFFDIGGNSLRLAEAHARLSEELRRPIELTALFQHPTIRSLAKFLSAEHGNRMNTSDSLARARRQRQAMARKQLTRKDS